MIASLLGRATGDFAMLPDKRKSISRRGKKSPPLPQRAGDVLGKRRFTAAHRG